VSRSGIRRLSRSGGLTGGGSRNSCRPIRAPRGPTRLWRLRTQYYGVDAFVFTSKAGRKQAFRYIIAPERIVHLSKEDAARTSPDFLMEELPLRLKAGPVSFHIKAQLAGAGDSTKDPTQARPDDRKLVDLGVLTIDRFVADSAEQQKQLLFLPGNLTAGIEPSDDPLIAARDGAYPISYARRNQ
jgi:catalase